MEEDLALDTRHEGLTGAEWRYKLEAWEKYDPGGKTAHEIAKGYIKADSQ